MSTNTLSMAYFMSCECKTSMRNKTVPGRPCPVPFPSSAGHCRAAHSASHLQSSLSSSAHRPRPYGSLLFQPCTSQAVSTQRIYAGDGGMTSLPPLQGRLCAAHKPRLMHAAMLIQEASQSNVPIAVDIASDRRRPVGDCCMRDLQKLIRNCEVYSGWPLGYSTVCL